MINVAVLAGGVSDEREVSLRSGQNVAQALDAVEFKTKLLDLGADPTEHLAALQAADVIFLALHGTGGEDGYIQRFLEAHDCRFVGSDAAASTLCFDKWRVKELLRRHGIPTPAGELVSGDSIWHSSFVSKPFVLKPLQNGSSIDTFIIRDTSTIAREAIENSLQKYDQMLIEELIVGTEITVGVLGEKALPVVEIIPPVDGEFDYTNKYNGATQELCPPQTISLKLQQQAQHYALTLHQLGGCRDFSRTDMIIDRMGGIYILEINTLPGMTTQSSLPKAAAATGMSMSELCTQLVEMALRRT